MAYISSRGATRKRRANLEHQCSPAICSPCFSVHSNIPLTLSKRLPPFFACSLFVVLMAEEVSPTSAPSVSELVSLVSTVKAQLDQQQAAQASILMQLSVLQQQQQSTPASSSDSPAPPPSGSSAVPQGSFCPVCFRVGRVHHLCCGFFIWRSLTTAITCGHLHLIVFASCVPRCVHAGQGLRDIAAFSLARV